MPISKSVYPLVQCAAVRMNFGEMIDPPQKEVVVPLLALIETVYGNCPVCDRVPPTILGLAFLSNNGKSFGGTCSTTS